MAPLPGQTAQHTAFQRETICVHEDGVTFAANLKCFEYGNCIYREKDLRDDGGVLQRPLGEGCRPEAQERRRAVGKMAHGRGSLRAVENQPAHVADVARQAAYRLLADKPTVLLQVGRGQAADSAYRYALSRRQVILLFTH